MMTLHVTGIKLWFLPVQFRTPRRSGPENLTHVPCARVAMTVRDERARMAVGWGESPLDVDWSWPSSELSHGRREETLRTICEWFARAWVSVAGSDAFALGHAVLERELPGWIQKFNTGRALPAPTRLAILVCNAPFDLALHDAAGKLAGAATFDLFAARHMSHELSSYLDNGAEGDACFAGRHPADYLARSVPRTIPAWHAVARSDPLDAMELNGDEPRDGLPLTLEQWIARDRLACLAIKLSGRDWLADYARVEKAGRIGLLRGAHQVSCEFECAVREPAYVSEMLDRLLREQSEIHHALVFVGQPFPCDPEARAVDVHEISRRKPLLMGAGVHDRQLIRRGRELGWSGVALSMCTTLTGALLSLCWARAHDMSVTVGGPASPMLAGMSQLIFAAHAGTWAGVESDVTRFRPDASLPESRIHPGMFRRRKGCLSVSSARGPGFGYRIEEIGRVLPEPALIVGETY